MRHLNAGQPPDDPMSPQVMLRRHASSAADVFHRAKEPVPRGHHTLKKRPAPARPPLPARLRSLSVQPLPTRTEPSANDCDDPKEEVYVNTATSRICLARSIDGLFDPPAPVIVVQTAGPVRGLQSLRSVMNDGSGEIQTISCWLGGPCFEQVANIRSIPSKSRLFDFLFASGSASLYTHPFSR